MKVLEELHFEASAFDAEADEDNVRSLQNSLELAEERAKQARKVITIAAAQPAERLAQR